MGQSAPGAFALVDVLSNGKTELALTLSTGGGVTNYLRWNKLAEDEKAAVVTEVAAVLAADGDAVQTLWTQATRSITVALTGVTPKTLTGLSGSTTYGLAVTVDGAAAINVLIPGYAALTYGDLVSFLETAVASVATVAWVQTDANNGAIKFTGKKYGASAADLVLANYAVGVTGLVTALDATAATVVIAALVDGVNGSTTDFAFPVTFSGAARADWNAALRARVVGGSTLLDKVASTAFVSKVDATSKPASKDKSVRTYVYFDGTDWKYFGNDTAVGGTGTTTTPPEAA